MFGILWLTPAVAVGLYVLVIFATFIGMVTLSVLSVRKGYLSKTENPSTEGLNAALRREWLQYNDMFFWGSIGWFLFIPFSIGVILFCYSKDSLIEAQVKWTEKSIQKYKDQNAEKYV